MVARETVMSEARSWLGTRWRHQSCAKGAGVDCLHFIAGTARNVGLELAEVFFATPEYRNYGRLPNADVLLKACDDLMVRIPLGTEQLADVLVIHFDKHPMHFAFVSNLDPRRLLHAWAGARRVVEHGIEAAWAGRVLRAYHLPGVAWHK